ncbi:MAG: ABC transporter ATP-binding protein [Thermoprotei archaeon]|nr:MAG: ABC transporter ATP-binding protein [Thermoprotei archaeon]
MLLIELRNVWKIYDSGSTRVVALREVNLDVKEGEFIAIVGPSGSGKSTLLHIIGGLDRPSKGVVRVAGIEVSSLRSDAELCKYRNELVGFVFQMFYLIPRLTALENVELPLIARGLDPRERRARALKALKLVGLEHRAHHRPAEMSGGEQQRVAIARAIVTEPKLILADEPTGNLDSANTRVVMDLFKKLNRALGVTILLATHNLELLSYCDKAVRLVDGRIAGIYEKERYDELVALSSKRLREYDNA